MHYNVNQYIFVVQFSGAAFSLILQIFWNYFCDYATYFRYVRYVETARHFFVLLLVSICENKAFLKHLPGNGDVCKTYTLVY